MSMVFPHSYTMIATIVSPFPMRAPLPDAVSGNEPAGRNVDGLERGGDNPSIEAALRGKTFTGTTERDTCPGANPCRIRKVECEQSIFSSKICGQECKTGKRVSVTCEWRPVMPREASGIISYTSPSHAYLLWVPSYGFSKKRETATSSLYAKIIKKATHESD